ncbi:unnamed protein product [Phytophthora fragariaefolia]|uniref:Unnamed protein product n=1 Tax=Phytophthora fragariaefolia TaxID=1490495 RepID=A0A9W6Y935_9STRA|nr:unnamed protein product [Phytophthora fragariaefolia]
MLDVCYTQLVTRSIEVLTTRPSTLAWMLNSSGLQGGLGRWDALLSNWTLEIVKCTKGEDEILGVIAASITPRANVDSILTSIAPRKQPRQVISMPPSTVESDEEPWYAARTAGAEDANGTDSRAQDEEKWIVDLKKYLTGDVRELTSTEAKSCAKIAEDYEIDDAGLLFYCPPSKQSYEDRDLVTRLVIPETLQEDVLHHYHSRLEGGHQGIGRTYQRIRVHFHWRGLYRSVQQYVGQCADCETGKGRPTMEGESPGNLQATYPLQTIAMDHIPSLPKFYKGNTELLIWIDLFAGYVIAKASASRTAQTIAENYEECVYRQFGASEVIRHDREPGFIADFFRSFNKIVGQKQRATMAYRPQANGTAERMVQTLT